GAYPANTRFGDFHVSYAENLGELVAADAFLYAGSTSSTPPDPAALRRIAGYGSSPIVTYEGEGIYFLDRVRPGVWRLEVYPDAVPVRDPFEPPNPAKIVTRAISRAWPMKVTLPDLGTAFTVQPLSIRPPDRPTASGEAVGRSVDGRFTVTPGVYILSAAGPVDVTTLPDTVNRVGLTEYHAPPRDTQPPSVLPLTPPEVLAGREAELRVRVVQLTPPDSVVLFLRPTAAGFYRGFPMRPAGGYEYSAVLPATALGEGPQEYVVTLFHGDSRLTFPAGLRARPWDWDYYSRESWKLNVVGPRTPLVLFEPGRDAGNLAFSRIGDAGRRGLFRLGMSEATGRVVFHLELPVRPSGAALDDYTASLVVQDRIAARRESIDSAREVQVRLRGLGPRQVLHLTLVEDDGTSWSAAVPVDSVWNERSLRLSDFTIGRAVLLPEGFPGEWNYWVGPAAGRGGAADHLRLDHVERVQVSLRREEGVPVTAGKYGVDVEWIRLDGNR
ncbi:MAG TPA: hypothetical protein VKP10_17335, partial [Gemmatimonadales bacterium]|nr:hypothetical protein [Gemmatimonadales bacterium]